MAARYEAPAVPIVCPPWCAMTADEHRAELDCWEGRVIHNSYDLNDPNGWGLSSIAWPDGTPDPEPAHIADGAPVVLMDGDTPVSPDKAEALARRILALVDEARGEHG